MDQIPNGIYYGDTKVFIPKGISVMIVTKMKETTKAFLGKSIKDAAVIVPNYFNDAQHQFGMHNNPRPVVHAKLTCTTTQFGMHTSLILCAQQA